MQNMHGQLPASGGVSELGVCLWALTTTATLPNQVDGTPWVENLRVILGDTDGAA